MDVPVASRLTAPPQRANQQRSLSHPGSQAVACRDTSPLARLQRTVGNRSINRLLHSRTIQPKLTVSHPDDALEREADDVADRVMRMVESGPIGGAQPGLQRKCTKCEEGKENSPAAASLQGVEGREDEFSESPQVTVQRKAEFRAAPLATAASSSTVADRLAGNKSGGELLASGTRDSMETAFGRDFSRVRVHRDREAAELSHQVSALAFTHGNHIYFGSGKYDPEGSSGKRLLAHELMHVVQQGQAAPRSERDAAPTATAVQATPPAIQRAANWRAAGTVHQTNNLANAVVNGSPVGVTWPTLNGSTFWSSAEVRAALAQPTLTFSAAASGGIDAKVTTVPTNTGSFDETVLARGPWRTAAPKATIGTMLPTLAACTGADNSTFRAIGDPSDAAMFAANRRHENHHASDHHVAFTGSIVPWDRRLTAAKVAGTAHNAPTQAEAEAALYAGMGGTPDEVADAFMDACAAAVGTFHGTPAGGAVEAPTNPTANADCSTSSAKYHNPS